MEVDVYLFTYKMGVLLATQQASLIFSRVCLYSLAGQCLFEKLDVLAYMLFIMAVYNFGLACCTGGSPNLPKFIASSPFFALDTIFFPHVPLFIISLPDHSAHHCQ